MVEFGKKNSNRFRAKGKTLKNKINKISYNKLKI